jgi:hypothetical protein
MIWSPPGERFSGITSKCRSHACRLLNVDDISLPMHQFAIGKAIHRRFHKTSPATILARRRPSTSCRAGPRWESTRRRRRAGPHMARRPSAIMSMNAEEAEKAVKGVPRLPRRVYRGGMPAECQPWLRATTGGQITAEHAAHQAQRRRSQCGPNPNLARALSDGEGHERVDAGRRKEQDNRCGWQNLRLILSMVLTNENVLASVVIT